MRKGHNVEINWFPGHMAKTLRKMKDHVKQVDLVIETCDARIPVSSRNPELSKLIGDKPLILVLNKADLADPEATRAWLSYFSHLGIHAIAIDSTKRSGPDQVQEAALALMQDKTDRSRERGRLFQPIRVMIAGIPNTGKSTLINTLVRRKVAMAQDKPGVTRSAAWVRSSGQLELLDTPGVLWPKLGSRKSQIALAATGAIRDVVLDLEEVTARVIYQLQIHYPQLLAERYGVGSALSDSASDETTGSKTSAAVESDEAMAGYDSEPAMLTADPELAAGSALLVAAARKRGCLQSGGRVDTARFSALFLDELRGGRIGRISLEWPPRQSDRTKDRGTASGQGTADTAAETENANAAAETKNANIITPAENADATAESETSMNAGYEEL